MEIKNKVTNKEEMAKELDNFLFEHGTPQEIAEKFETILFDWIITFIEQGHCGGSYDVQLIHQVRGIRDFFNKIK